MKTRAALVALLFLTGCSYEGAQSLPLPGAVGGKDTYTVTIVLADATNLVAKETCRSNDTIIGHIESVTLDDQLQAKVVCRIRNSVALPANITATVRETSLLGERFVALGPPTGVEPKGRLAPDAVVPQDATRVDPNVEMVFGALSQVLNGGSLGKLDTITRELNTALSQSDLAGTFHRLGTFVDVLDDNRDDITASLVALDKLAGSLARQRGVIADALDSVPSGLQVLDRQRPALVQSLRSLSRLSRVAVPLIRRSKADTVADLRHLAPVLKALTKEGHGLAATLERALSFPFPSNGMAVIKGDYGGMIADIDIDIDMLNALLAGQIPKPAAGGAKDQTPQPGLPGLQLPGLQLPDLPVLPELLDLLGLNTLGGGS
ncbi:MAG TPA: MCE family protein [Nocardioidaceae bacterium]|nr:MCE family protein [Nocardioidaceae bacterium]